MNTQNYDNLILNQYISKNKVLFKQPIIKRFFSDKDNKKLLLHFIKGNHLSKKELDDKFKSFYQKAKVISYVSNLIHFYSIDYDKKINQISHRFPLVLDQPLSKNEDESLKLIDLFYNEDMNYEEAVNEKRLEDVLTDEVICKAVDTLTVKQKNILELIYIKGYTPKDVAKLYGDSKQNISNIKSKAIKKISDYYTFNNVKQNRECVSLSS